MRSYEALQQIQELMDGVEWTPDTLDAIADVVKKAGYTVREVGEDWQPPTVYDSLPSEDENGIMDRFTVFPAGEIETPKERYNYLGCSFGGRAVSMWGEIKHSDVDDFDHLGRKVPFHELDEDTQRHIFNRLKD